MAESRGGKEDRRLKDSFQRLWEKGSNFVEPRQFQAALSSSQLKVKAKTLNVAGLQLADLVAHPSRNEILREHGLLAEALAPFAQQIVGILSRKYDRREEEVFGKKLL